LKEGAGSREQGAGNIPFSCLAVKLVSLGLPSALPEGLVKTERIHTSTEKLTIVAVFAAFYSCIINAQNIQ